MTGVEWNVTLKVHCTPHLISLASLRCYAALEPRFKRTQCTAAQHLLLSWSSNRLPVYVSVHGAHRAVQPGGSGAP